jgi:orotidine-5'-phosphate decarboxylase
MSNPEYARQKDKRRAGAGGPGSPGGPESPRGPEPEPQYLELAGEARAAGADGVVVGAPSPANHIDEAELAAVAERIGPETVVLMPGVGAQGGDAAGVWRSFDPDQVIVNAGRALMFPAGSASAPAEQAAAAEALRDELNAGRRARGAAR